MIHPPRLAPNLSGHMAIKWPLDYWVLGSPVLARKFRVMAVLEWPVIRILRILIFVF
jgi:hypothetical protein